MDISISIGMGYSMWEGVEDRSGDIMWGRYYSIFYYIIIKIIKISILSNNIILYLYTYIYIYL